MEEFIRLYLTGVRAENMARFRRVAMVFGLIGAVLALLPVLFTFAVENVPLTVAFSVLGVLFGAASVALKWYEVAYLRVLVELQSAANALELRGEERARSETLYAVWTETLGKRGALRRIAMALTGLSYVLLAVTAIVCVVYSLPSFVLLIACIVFGVLSAVASGMQTVAEGRARAALYERAEKEIGELKREKLCLSERKIAAEAENARGFSQLPVSVALFLKDGVEREEFRAIDRRSGIIGFSVGFALGVAIVLPMLLGDLWNRLGSTVSWLLAGSVLVTATGVLFALLLPLEAKKNEIYRRNEEKLTKGETDDIRRRLQTAWIRSQRRGNGMFLAFLVASVAGGLVLGLIGYFTGEGTVLADCIGSSIMALLVPAAILSLIIWMIMFACYRRKARPLEAQLREKLAEEEK